MVPGRSRSPGGVSWLFRFRSVGGGRRVRCAGARGRLRPCVPRSVFRLSGCPLGCRCGSSGVSVLAAVVGRAPGPSSFRPRAWSLFPRPRSPSRRVGRLPRPVRRRGPSLGRGSGASGVRCRSFRGPFGRAGPVRRGAAGPWWPESFGCSCSRFRAAFGSGGGWAGVGVLFVLLGSWFYVGPVLLV